MNYQLKSSRKTKAGFIEHDVLLPGNIDRTFRYFSLRVGLVWPGQSNPGFFVVGGEEVWDEELYAADRGVISVIQEEEIQDLSLDTLFGKVTDSYTSMKCDSIYCEFKQKDFYIRFWEYLDRSNLRQVNLLDVPYEQMVFRMGLIADLNNAGNFTIEKSSPLYADLQSVSRVHLENSPETKFFRLNALSYLVSGFAKYPPVKKLKEPRGRARDFGKGHGWLAR